jgi:hypothetical protein
MTIDVADMLHYESLDNDSLGGDISTNIVNSGLNQLFNAVELAEATAGSVKYRCIFVKNESLDILAAANVYVHGLTPSPSTYLELGLGLGGMNSAGQSILTGEEEPAGVIWDTPTESAPLPIGDMNPGDYHAVWIKRVVAANAVGTSNDNAVLGFAGDQTAP